MIFKPSATIGVLQSLLTLHDSGGTGLAELYVDTVNMAAWNGSAVTGSPPSTLNTTAWWLVVFRKATGTVAGRWSMYNFTSTTWAHQASSPSIADWSAPGASGSVKHSFEGGSEFCQSRVAVRAAWSNSLPWAADSSGDTALEAAGLEDSLQAWTDASPSALWPYNQANVADDLLDTIGAADETSIVGTTVINGDDPPGFTFSSGNATASPAVIATTATLPAPAVSVASAPAVIARSLTLPAPTVSVGAAPAVIARSVALPAPAVSVAAAPSVLTTAATLPAPAVSVPPLQQ